MTLVIILQVNKNGAANAPTWVEHMVDTTISLSHKRVFIGKNRYGERGTFERGSFGARRDRKLVAVT